MFSATLAVLSSEVCSLCIGQYLKSHNCIHNWIVNMVNVIPDRHHYRAASETVDSLSCIVSIHFIVFGQQ